ncbi:MAG: dTMP kinase [Desulfofustis sp.]|nr:dTMP kinase [Desulfofustis sp.]NNK56237.1 dTMP kinase [Desulfofustis sp.]RZW26926.1 MAG: dTMP kinase [Desulfobulbaceae bacterium]
MTKTKKGTFIVFEGIDGTGKSTQIIRLANAFKKMGHDVVVTSEPTEGVFGKKIRALYQNRSMVSTSEELDLFIKDRREHIDTLINPSLRAGKIVLSDRYFLSTAAYQGAAGCSPEAIIACHRFAPDPDLAIIIEVPPQLCIRRITEKRGDQLNDFEQLESLKKVDSIFKQMDLPYLERVDGSVAEEDVHRQVRELIKRLLPHLFHSVSGEHQ